MRSWITITEQRSDPAWRLPTGQCLAAGINIFVLSMLMGLFPAGGNGSKLEAQSQAAAPGPTVIFSTDYGLGLINGATNGPDSHPTDVDDAYAVTLALAGGLDVIGIVTIFGNAKEASSYQSAVKGLAALGRQDIPVLHGAQSPIAAEPVYFATSSGISTAFPYCVNEGVTFMKEELERRDSGTVSILAIGPFSDVACLVRWHPQAASKLKSIVALVGSANGTLNLQGHSVVDFNFAMDPAALGIVIGAKLTTFVSMMFEVTQLGVLPNSTIDRWARNRDHPIRYYYGKSTQPHAKYWDQIFTDTKGQALFDANTAYYVLNPDTFECASTTGTVVIGGAPGASTATNCFAVGNTCTSKTTENPTRITGPVIGCSAYSSGAIEGTAAFVQAVIESVPAK